MCHDLIHCHVSYSHSLVFMPWNSFENLAKYGRWDERGGGKIVGSGSRGGSL
jgi:hypothetical protein